MDILVYKIAFNDEEGGAATVIENSQGNILSAGGYKEIENPSTHLAWMYFHGDADVTVLLLLTIAWLIIFGVWDLGLESRSMS